MESIPISLPYEFAKSMRVLLLQKENKSHIYSEKNLSKFLYQEIARFLLDDFKVASFTNV